MHSSHELGVLRSLMAEEDLLPAENLAAHAARDGFALAQVNKTHVAARILRGGVDLAAQLTGHAIRRQVV